MLVGMEAAVGDARGVRGVQTAGCGNRPGTRIRVSTRTGLGIRLGRAASGWNMPVAWACARRLGQPPRGPRPVTVVRERPGRAYRPALSCPSRSAWAAADHDASPMDSAWGLGGREGRRAVDSESESPGGPNLNARPAAAARRCSPSAGVTRRCPWGGRRRRRHRAAPLRACCSLRVVGPTLAAEHMHMRPRRQTDNKDKWLY